MEEEQLLFPADLAVVALGGLLLEVLPFLELLLTYTKLALSEAVPFHRH